MAAQVQKNDACNKSIQIILNSHYIYSGERKLSEPWPIDDINFLGRNFQLQNVIKNRMAINMIASDRKLCLCSLMRILVFVINLAEIDTHSVLS